MKTPEVVARIAKVRAAKLNRVAALRLQWHSCKDRDAWLKENEAVVISKVTKPVAEWEWSFECGEADCYGVHKHYQAVVAGYLTTRREIKLLK